MKLSAIRPDTIAVFAAGTLTGLLICLPLIPYVLPDSTATLLGAAIGAALAVGGAHWIVDAKERRSRIECRTFILRELGAFQRKMHEEIAAIKQAADGGVGADFEAHFGQLKNMPIEAMQRRLVEMRGLFEHIGPGGVMAFAEAKEALSQLKGKRDLMHRPTSWFFLQERIEADVSMLDQAIGRLH